MTRLLPFLLSATLVWGAENVPSPKSSERNIKRQFGDFGSIIGSSFGSQLGKMKGEPGGCKTTPNTYCFKSNDSS
jgi:hypothetical protein